MGIIGKLFERMTGVDMVDKVWCAMKLKIFTIISKNYNFWQRKHAVSQSYFLPNGNMRGI
jgi:hypothetical protein